VAGVAPLLGSEPAAHLAAAAVRIGYLLSVAGSFVLLLFPLRHVLADVLLGGHDALQRRWLPATAGLVASAYATACYLPSIWGALSLVGATATTAQAWIVPSLVMLALERQLAAGMGGGGAGTGAAAAGFGKGDGGAVARWARAGRVAVAGLILIVGSAMFANAIVGEVLRRVAAQTL
jgi:hypothetical protein